MCDGPPADAPPPKVTNEIRDITNLINSAGTYCLNEDDAFTHSNLFMGDDRLVLRSDVDEQLIIHVEFNEQVKLHSVGFAAPDDDSAPTLVKLFKNATNLGFQDAPDVAPTQSLTLTPEDLQSESVCLLKFVKFQSCNSVTIFVEENAGAEQTVLSSLRFFGAPLQGFDMNNFKKVG